MPPLLSPLPSPRRPQGDAASRLRLPDALCLLVSVVPDAQSLAPLSLPYTPPPMSTPKPFIGIDLGGTNMQIGVVSPDLKIIGPAKRKTKPEDKLEGVLDRMIDGITEACAAAQIPVSALGGIGVGAPGAVDPATGVVLEAVNLRWDNVPLADLLTKRLKVRTFLDNDVNVAVYGEHKMGSGQGVDNLLGLWVGTGIGGGLILNGKLFYGQFMTAGEIGHTILHAHHARGQRSLEHNTSRTAIVDRLARLLRSNQKSKITAEIGDDYGAIKSRTLRKYYHGGEKADRVVCEVIDHAADELGIAIANAVTLLSLSRVVVGGGLTESLGAPFVDRIQKSARDLAFPECCRVVNVVPSQLADNAGVFGAAMIAMDRVKTRA